MESYYLQDRIQRVLQGQHKMRSLVHHDDNVRQRTISSTRNIQFNAVDKHTSISGFIPSNRPNSYAESTTVIADNMIMSVVENLHTDYNT